MKALKIVKLPLQLLCQRFSLNRKISKANRIMILPEPAETPEVLEEEIIRLLGERLVVDRGKRKLVR